MRNKRDPRIQDLTTQKFERLQPISLAPKLEANAHKGARWVCLCDCGSTFIARANSLKTGNTRSCGCLKKDRMTAHGCWRHPYYKTWSSMTQRCLNPNYTGFADYGGRGISVCAEWLHDPQAFFDYMGPKPTPQHSVDRINNDGGYEPGNVKWSTKSEQALNRRPRSI